MSNSLKLPDSSLPGSTIHGIFQARILEWGCHFLLQEIFLTQGLSAGLPHCRQTLYCLSHQGSSKMKVKFAQLCLTLCNPMDYTVQGILQARILEWVAFPFSGDLPNPGIKPRSLTLQANSLPAEPQRKPKSTGAGSLFLFQQIFLAQESNRGVLHYRQFLYQLSYEGSP